ncbi:hypothetical protein FGG08_002797 [Glutinoglossum americanum]|uniref:MFS general substrate transporter n=1 Tax=Glutinoglossum americanum TaxID=1670608 RepID=A0A9P8KYU2_9PEZI|nr:hypothetical protein FGG08_002797 [Glutinoglossum americanum]
MADLEKSADYTEAGAASRPRGQHSEPVNLRPAGWMYKQARIGPIRLPWYASPMSQLLVVSFVCFLCPGMFNALSGLGGGGQVNPNVNNSANVALYSTFASVAFFAGTIANRLGIKLTLSLGGLGYSIYAASLLCYDHTNNAGFVIFSGALLGVCAALLWTAQGAIMMSYPSEGIKGRYISIFWMIFNFGAVLGSLIPLGQNLHSYSNKVNDGTYVGFIILMFFGAILALFLVDSKNVIRDDGSKVIVMKHPTWTTEFMGLWEVLRTDTYIVALFPMFFASNWFYSYQFNDVNLAQFNIRTRALNNVLYWLSQILGAWTFGYALDLKYISRSSRAKVVMVVLFSVTMAVWGGGYAFQKRYTRSDVSPKNYVKLDWTSNGYIGPMFLYMMYGFFDAAWQTTVYWLMGSLTNNARKTAFFAGFYKAIQSSGSAIIYRLDTLEIPFINLFASCWALLAGSIVVAAPVVLWKIKDHVSIEEDLKFSDETEEDVLASTRKVEHS